MRQVGYLPELYEDARSEIYEIYCLIITNAVTWSYIQGDQKVSVQLTIYCNHKVHRVFDHPV